jgi:exo-beta-1,3-glucanase (GH17 family)
MRKILVILLLILAAGTLLAEQSQLVIIEREEPFIIRQHDPYLDGEWIGKAVSYGCYRKGQAPGAKGPTKAEIFEDLQIISNYWNLIRVYNADDDSERILEVICDNDLPVKVMLGVWLENEKNHQKMNQINTQRAIELSKRFPQIIIAVNVGNETQVFWSWHKMAMEDLVKYIREVRSKTKIPVTTADDYNFWNKPESRKVAEEIDFIVSHIYPLWNGKTLSESIPWLDSIYRGIDELHADKQVVLGEIGWATEYNAEKKGDGEQGSLVKGEVSVAAQGEFLRKLEIWSVENKVTTFWFEAFDEPWKGGGENTGTNEIEKNWGVFYENRTPKESFKNFIKQRNNLSKQILKEEE